MSSKSNSDAWLTTSPCSHFIFARNNKPSLGNWVPRSHFLSFSIWMYCCTPTPTLPPSSFLPFFLLLLLLHLIWDNFLFYLVDFKILYLWECWCKCVFLCHRRRRRLQLKFTQAFLSPSFSLRRFLWTRRRCRRRRRSRTSVIIRWIDWVLWASLSTQLSSRCPWIKHTRVPCLSDADRGRASYSC